MFEKIVADTFDSEASFMFDREDDLMETWKVIIGWTRLNTDGAVSKFRKVSCGGLIKLWGVFEGMKLVREQDYTKVKLQVDIRNWNSKILVKKLAMLLKEGTQEH